MKLIASILIVFFSFNFGQAQDSVLIKEHHQKGKNNILINSDTCIYYLEKAAQLSQDLTELNLRINMDLGEAYTNHGRIKDAVELMNGLRDEVISSGDQKILSHYLRILGYSQHKLGDQNTGFLNLYNSLDAANRANSDLEIIMVEYALSSIFTGNGQMDSCIFYAEKVLRKAEGTFPDYYIQALHDYGNALILHDNIQGKKHLQKAIELSDQAGYDYLSGAIRINYGIYFFHHQQMETCIELWKDAQEYIIRSNSLDLVNFNYLLLGIISDYEGRPNQTLNLQRTAFKNATHRGEKRNIANAARQISETFDQIGLSDSAYYYLQISEKISKSEKNIEGLNVTYKMLNQHFDNLGKTDSAYKYVQLSNSYHDSLRVIHTDQYATATEQKFQNEKLSNQLKIEEITRENDKKSAQRNYIILGTLIVAGLALALYFRLRRKRQKEKQILEFQNQINELESKSLEQQLDPHFMASVTSKSTLLIEQGKHQEAKKFLEKALEFWRNSLYKNRLQEKITLKDELNQVRAFLDIKKEINDIPFDYVINCPNELLNAQFPGFLIQPLLENSIKYAFAEDKNNLIEINIKQEKDSLLIEVKDNGGTETISSTYSGSGQGMEIVKDRIRLINKIYKRDSEANFELKSNESIFKFNLPLLL